MCPLCKSRNATPSVFYQTLDSAGQRLDQQLRPDLSQLAYDISAPEAYIERPPAPLTFCFLLDCSQAALKCGLIDAFCETIEEMVKTEAFPGLPRTQIAFILVSAEVHLIRFADDSDAVQMISLGQATETAFLPVPLDQILVSLQEKSVAILRVLRLIRAFAASSFLSNSGFKMGLTYLHTLLQASGGKAIALLCNITTPTGSNPSLSTTSDITSPNGYDSWYRDIGKQFGFKGISVDLYFLSNHCSELNSLVHLSEQTGGSLFLYPKDFPASKLSSELYLSLTRDQMWDVTVRLRVNKDWRVVQAYGSFMVREGDLLGMQVAHAGSSLAYRVEMDDQVIHQGKMYLQAAVLYTTTASERRIRVLNLSLKVSNDRYEILSAAEPETITTLWARMAMVQSEESNDFGAGKSGVERKLRMLMAYAPSLPRNLEFLPYYVLGLVKMTVFHGGRALTKGVPALICDIPAFQRHALLTWPSNSLCQLLYPRLYCLTNPPLSDTDPPTPLNLTVTSLSKAQIYLLDTGLDLLLWLGTYPAGT
jgi:protein transport protein SEC24